MQEAEKFLRNIERDLKADLSAKLKELASRKPYLPRRFFCVYPTRNFIRI